MSPIYYLLSCPNCHHVFHPQHLDLDRMWDCVFCRDWLDLYWMVDDVSWVPPLQVDYEREFRDEEVLSADYTSSGYPRLCCDRYFDDCTCGIHEEIFEDSVRDYSSFNNLSLSEIYSRTHSTCVNCKYFADEGCIPLRNLIRFHFATNLLPFFLLTRCRHYQPDSDMYLDPPTKVQATVHSLREKEWVSDD